MVRIYRHAGIFSSQNFVVLLERECTGFPFQTRSASRITRSRTWIEEAKLRDHRNIGKEQVNDLKSNVDMNVIVVDRQEFFMFHPLSPGMLFMSM
eukprot:753428-Hanusia_phi.AAC.7